MVVDDLPVAATSVRFGFGMYSGSWSIERNWTKVPTEFVRGRRYKEDEIVVLSALACMGSMEDGFYSVRTASSWSTLRRKQYRSTYVGIDLAKEGLESPIAYYGSEYYGSLEFLRVTNLPSFFSHVHKPVVFTKDELNGKAADILKRGCRVAYPEELEQAKKPSSKGPGLDVKVQGSFATPAPDTPRLKRVIVFGRDRRTYMIGYYDRAGSAIRCKIQGNDYAWKVDPDWFN